MNQKSLVKSRYIWAIFLSLFMLGFSIQADAAKPKTEAQQLKHDKKYKGFTEKKLHSIRKNISANSLTSAKKGIKQAEKYIGKISSGFMAGAEGTALRKELDLLKKKVADMSAGAATASANANALLQEKINYGSSVKKHATAYYLLNAGKEKSAGNYAYDLDDIETLKNELPEFLAYENEFKKSFPNLIQSTPDYEYEGIQVGNLLDLFPNASAYQANFTDVVGNRLLDNLFAQTENIVSELDAHNMIPSAWLDDHLYGSTPTNDYFDIDKTLKPYYDAVSRPLPNDRLQKLATFKPKIMKMLESIAKKLSWDSKSYSVQNSDMKKIAQLTAKKKGWKLVEYGSTDTAVLTKNALGVPLHKAYKGMIVVQANKEPFNRAYHVVFYDHFDGTGYPGVSELEFTSRAMPFAQ